MAARSIAGTRASSLALAALAGALVLSVAAIGRALEPPPLEGRVNDLAGLLDDAARERIEQQLAQLEQDTGAQVAVLTVPSLEGGSLEDLSLRVVEAWRLGREGVDDGALLVVAVGERQLRLEVGYGLEGVLPDAIARRIVDGVIVPRLQQGDFAGGIEAGLASVAARIRGESDPAALPPPAPSAAWRLLSELFAAASGCLVPIAIVALLFLLSYFERHHPKLFAKLSSSGTSGGSSSSFHRSSWSSGSSRSSSGGSRSFSGGGGRFGGGGASGRW
jgi:uncharacterized protein